MDGDADAMAKSLGKVFKPNTLFISLKRQRGNDIDDNNSSTSYVNNNDATRATTINT